MKDHFLTAQKAGPFYWKVCFVIIDGSQLLLPTDEGFTKYEEIYFKILMSQFCQIFVLREDPKLARWKSCRCWCYKNNNEKFSPTCHKFSVTRFDEISPHWQNFKSYLGKILRVNLVFGKMLILPWQKCDAIGQVFIVVDAQIFFLKIRHLVTLLNFIQRGVVAFR